MRRSYWLLAIALLSALGLGTLAGPAQAAPARADIPGGQGFPLSIQTDGAYVAWTLQIEPSRFSRYVDLYAAAIGDAQPTLIATRLNYSAYMNALHPNFALDAGTLVWIDSTMDHPEAQPLRARSLRTGETKTVAETAASFPAISGSTVYWWGNIDLSGDLGDQPAVLKARDIGAMSDPATLAQLPPSGFMVFGLRASPGWLTWEQSVASDDQNSTPCWDLYALPIAGGASQRVDSLGCMSMFSLNAGELSGDMLAYTNSYHNLVIRNLATGAIDHMSGPHLNNGNALNGRYVFWNNLDSRTVWGFDPNSESAFPIAQSQAGSPPAAHGGIVAWLDDAGPQSTVVHARPAAELLPSARVPAVDGRGYFPETGHTLGGAFRDYWNRNGGLPVFGYALTEEFTQRAPESAYGYTVQYFERQRFEYHPENAGTPYEVLLGRLGAEALAAQGRDWQALPKADPATPHYYAPTGQAIAPEFWNYWRTHGLEFGDPGVSEREALALWGYPISPPALEQVPTGETLLVQWFERARFEYHPANADPYKVLLGRLAADRVDAFGWK